MSEQKSYLDNLIGVFGHPVAENPTVVMHEAAFRHLELPWRYLTVEVLPDALEDAVRGLRAMNFRGINLTIPHKVAVLPLLDRISDEARIMEAVNTVRRDGDELVGENTDGKGFLKALREDGKVDPAGKRIVILGAGGAARAIGVELALAGAGHITIVNRSTGRGRTLVSLLTDRTEVAAVFVKWDGAYAVPDDTDVVVNATSIGLFPDVEKKPEIDYRSITGSMIVCDVIPNPPRTPFLEAAAGTGAKTLDGLGMLVYQGAIAFRMWTGEEPPVDVMKKALSDEFGI